MQKRTYCNNICDNKLYSFIAALCVFSQQAFIENFGYEQVNTIGYTEKDGLPGLTSEDEKVVLDDLIEAGVIVFVDCSNW
jgi:hypothetical protein